MKIITLLLLLITQSQYLLASGMDNDLALQIQNLQHDWAIANYQADDDKTEVAFEKLTQQAQRIVINNKDKAEPLIWQAIILSSDAGKNGGFSALSKVKQARDLLLQAEKINPLALQGSIYTSLGSLYNKVPSWPLGFGDSEQAEIYLKKALKINPTGIDANYFYADYLFDQNKFTQAKNYFNKALNASNRSKRPIADAGRRDEINHKLQLIKSEI